MCFRFISAIYIAIPGEQTLLNTNAPVTAERVRIAHSSHSRFGNHKSEWRIRRRAMSLPMCLSRCAVGAIIELSITCLFPPVNQCWSTWRPLVSGSERIVVRFAIVVTLHFDGCSSSGFCARLWFHLEFESVEGANVQPFVCPFERFFRHEHNAKNYGWSNLECRV